MILLLLVVVLLKCIDYSNYTANTLHEHFRREMRNRCLCVDMVVESRSVDKDI